MRPRTIASQRSTSTRSAGYAPFGFSATEGFPVTAHNGSQVFSLGNTTTIGQKLNWEQRLGFVRMGTFSGYNQTLPGGNLGVSAAQTNNLTANVLPGLQINNFGDQRPVFAVALSRSCRSARRLCEHGLLPEPSESFHQRDPDRRQAHHHRGRRIQLHPTEHHQ